MIQRILNPAKARRTLRKTAAVLADTLADVTQAQAVFLRDGTAGWSVLFVVCHLCDYEIALRARVEVMLAEHDPTFRTFDQLAMVETHAYARQECHAVLAEGAERRAALIARLEHLDDAQWLRAGRHPEQGTGTILDVAINLDTLRPPARVHW